MEDQGEIRTMVRVAGEDRKEMQTQGGEAVEDMAEAEAEAAERSVGDVKAEVAVNDAVAVTDVDQVTVMKETRGKQDAGEIRGEPLPPLMSLILLLGMIFRPPSKNQNQNQHQYQMQTPRFSPNWPQIELFRLIPKIWKKQHRTKLELLSITFLIRRITEH